jgi:hypothetical protein
MTDPNQPSGPSNDQPYIPPAPPAPSYSAPGAPGAPGASPYTTPYGQGQYGQGPAGVPDKKPLSITSMALGIASAALSFLIFLWFLAIPLGIAAIVLAVLGKRKERNAKGFWLTGLITGIVGIALSLLIVIVGAIALAAFSNSGYSGTVSP